MHGLLVTWLMHGVVTLLMHGLFVKWNMNSLVMTLPKYGLMNDFLTRLMHTWSFCIAIFMTLLM